MNRHTAAAWLAAAAAAVLASWPQAAPADPPALAVIIVVDQMRADYIDRFGADWKGGLKRLVAQGAWFQRAAYPYLSTLTCPGHATIATGAFPHAHGVIQNAWWDREARKQMTCTEDPRGSDIGYGVPVTGGDSAYRLQVPTFTDAMRTGRHAHVVTLALKDRSAIMLAGHGGDAVTWLSNSLDGWVTSSAYAERPAPAVKAFVDANPMSADFGKTWNRRLPASRYRGADDGLAEAPPAGWTRVFPHALTGTAGKVDVSFFTQWERSPFADAYVGRFASALVESMQLGKHGGTDVLGVSFSSPDLVGHAFGPSSQEIQDMYVRLDETLGMFFDRLDRLVGKDRWVVGLTGDHGVTAIPEQLAAGGKNAGRIDGPSIVDAVERVLRPVLGEGRHVTVLDNTDLYFEPGVYGKIARSRALGDAVVAAIAARPGVQRVFRGEQVRGAATSSDPLLRAAALSYFPGRSGDLILAPKPGWMFYATGTTHGSATADDQRVPILFMGHGIKPGTYQQPATPADVVPTLAVIVGIAMPTAEGHPLPCVR
jgi:predicted AlkP superfamily pyrophosphatase or phosphodiesterase